MMRRGNHREAGQALAPDGKSSSGAADADAFASKSAVTLRGALGRAGSTTTLHSMGDESSTSSHGYVAGGSLAHPVSSTRSTLAQLEAFLHREDSQAHLLAGGADDDDSLEDDFKRLRDGEARTRMELEGLWLSGAVGGWKDSDHDLAMDGSEECVDFFDQDDKRRPVRLHPVPDAPISSVPTDAADMVAAASELIDTLGASSQSFEDDVGLDLSEAFDCISSEVVQLPSCSNDHLKVEGHGLARAHNDDTEWSGGEIRREPALSSSHLDRNPRADAQRQSPLCSLRSTHKRAVGTQHNLPSSPLSTEGSLSSRSIGGLDLACDAHCSPSPPALQLDDVALGSNDLGTIHDSSFFKNTITRTNLRRCEGASPTLLALCVLSDQLADLLYGHSVEIESKPGRFVGPHHLIAGVVAAVCTLKLFFV